MEHPILLKWLRGWDSRRRLLRPPQRGGSKGTFRDARRAERVQYAGAVVLAEIVAETDAREMPSS